jgi:hypothetical protein
MKKRALSLLAPLLLLGAALIAAQPARAQTALYLGSTFSYNGLSFTVSACTFSNDSRNSTCNATDYSRYLPAGTQFYIAADPSAPTTSVIIEALNGGSQVPMFSYTCSTSGGCSNSNSYDLGVTLTVTPASGTISSMVETLNATALTSSHTPDTTVIANDPSDVSAEETVAGSLCNGSSGLNTNLATLSQSCTFAPQSSLSVTKDLGISVEGVTNGTTLALNSVVENFAHAPEPSSLAMLVPGLLMLGWTYRRKLLR